MVETTGTTDTIGVLEDSAGNQIEEHDDQDLNTNRNFKIYWAVNTGTYYIRVGAYRDHTGDYTLHVSHVPVDDGSDDSEGEGEDETEDGGDSEDEGDDTQENSVIPLPSLGDLNGDGRDDVLLRHTDGRWYYYPMDGRRHLVGQRGGAGIEGIPFVGRYHDVSNDIQGTGLSTFYDTLVFTADFEIFTIDDIIAEHGERLSDWTSSQKDFRAAVILLTDEDHPATSEIKQQMSEHVTAFSFQGDDESRSFNYYEATGGRSTISMGDLSRYRKETPTQVVTERLGSFGIAAPPVD